MKDRTKGFLAGVACTALTLSLAATAFAAAGSVSFNSVNLRFNGQQISAKGENYTIGTGASVPASILYTDENGGGTTYLPIARISDLLDTPIGWDGDTGSVRIGEEPVSPLPADYSDWSAEQEAAYQEFKAMWTFEFCAEGEGISDASGKYDTTPWISFDAFYNKNDEFDSIQGNEDDTSIGCQVANANKTGMVARIGEELCDDNRDVWIRFQFDGYIRAYHARGGTV